MLIKTDKAAEVWKSNDGQVHIWELNIVAANGKKYAVRTYSPEIAERGFEGDVQSYKDEKGRTYIKFKEADKPVTFDRSAEIRAQFAIKAAVELLRCPENPEVEVSAQLIEHWAGVFFDMVPKIATRGGDQ